MLPHRAFSRRYRRAQTTRMWRRRRGGTPVGLPPTGLAQEMHIRPAHAGTPLSNRLTSEDRMMRSRKDRYAVGLAAAVAALGCREPTAPPPPRGDLLALPAGTRATGLGAIRPDSGVRLGFDFDVSDAPGGRFSLT